MKRIPLGLAGAALQLAVALGPAAWSTSKGLPAGALVAGCLIAIATMLETWVQDGRGDLEVAHGIDAWLARASGIGLLSSVVVACTEAARRGTGHDVAIVSGAVLLACGVALRVLAVRALRDRFVAPAIAPAGRLVTHGVYALVRHPSETGLLALGLGACVACESFAAVAVWGAVVLPSSIRRCRREDAVLAAAFGDEHAGWARRVPALLPVLRFAGADPGLDRRARA